MLWTLDTLIFEGWWWDETFVCWGFGIWNFWHESSICKLALRFHWKKIVGKLSAWFAGQHATAFCANVPIKAVRQKQSVLLQLRAIDFLLAIVCVSYLHSAYCMCVYYISDELRTCPCCQITNMIMWVMNISFYSRNPSLTCLVSTYVRQHACCSHLKNAPECQRINCLEWQTLESRVLLQGLKPQTYILAQP